MRTDFGLRTSGFGLLVLVLAMVACDRGEHRAAREKYNDGLALLVKSDFEGAEKALSEAWGSAGVDNELRFRASYNLGMAYVAHAEKLKTGKDANLSKALELEQQAIQAFADALRLRPKDEGTRKNVAIARARAQALADEISRGEGKLEKRLDALIDAQRQVLEGARQAWVAVKRARGANPLAQQSSLVHLADTERGIVAEAGVVGDLAAQEIDDIGKKAEDKRTDQEKVRVVQLKNLDLYLLEGRARIAEARRKLQDLAAEDGLGRAEAALVALKRAREQLYDPIHVLRDVAGDELALAKDTHQVDDALGGTKVLPGKTDESTALPLWLQPPALAERQGGLRDRVEEIRARLQTAVENADKTGSDGKQPQAEEPKLFERLKVALPFVVEASAAMDRARTALSDKQLKDAELAEREALIAIAKAIEQFADLKQTIELAYDTQEQLVALLGPEAAKQLAPADRIAETRDALAANLARMPRLQELIADEQAKLAAQEQQIEAKVAQAGSGSGSGSAKVDPKQVEAARQQLAAMKDRLAHAETLRADADKALQDLDAAIKNAKDPMAPAQTAEQKIAELRELFFDLLEHLKELIKQQGETRDQTSAASIEDDFTRAPKLPGLETREQQHAAIAKAITDALAKEADAASKAAAAGQGQAQPQPGQPDAKALSGAADEVRLAQNDMSDAIGTIGKVAAAKNQSLSLDPATESQKKALEHLENALKLLQPPQQGQQNKDDQQQQQGGNGGGGGSDDQQPSKDEKKPQDQQQQGQQQQQGGAGQRARDEDAKRQRMRANGDQSDPSRPPQGASQSEPVETDW